MAEDLMATRNRPRARAAQAGFSMVEMLMTAFVLAIGLLGLCLLQTMSLRGSRGSRSLMTAVHVAEGVMDEVEMEGRLSWLNITDNPSAAPASLYANFKYIPLAVGATYNSPNGEQYNIMGESLTSSPAPTLTTPFFTAYTVHVDDVGNGGGKGQVSDYSVTVKFTDSPSASSTGGQRQVVMTRRIIHG
jgi:prepilin-type N-terminal cleavage/methylation domain-containing protein